MSGLDEQHKDVPDGEEDTELVVESEGGDLEEEYAADELGEDELSDFDDVDEDLKVVDEALSHKDQNARALAVRRAIEERLEAKRMSKDLDYLDLDLDPDD
ncbi:MAG: PA3496 family putative envelope integrity protein [Pseudomonadales bacterium]